VRVYTFNVTASTVYRPRAADLEDEEAETPSIFSALRQRVFGSPLVDIDAKGRRGRRRKGRKRKKPSGFPRLPRHAAPDSPSRTNRYLTPLGYTQWFIDLARANAAGDDVRPEWEIEYTTYDRPTLEGFLRGDADHDTPTPFPWVGETVVGVERRSWKELTPYGMPDLTLGRWLELAHDLGRHGWKGFRTRMFVSTD
jgi:endopolyphosphatase